MFAEQVYTVEGFQVSYLWLFSAPGLQMHQNLRRSREWSLE